MGPLILKINRESNVESHSCERLYDLLIRPTVVNRYWHTRKVQHYIMSRVYEPRLTDYSKQRLMRACVCACVYYLPPEGHGLTN